MKLAAVLESEQFLQWFSGLKSSSGSQHSFYEIKKTDDTHKAMMLAYRAYPIFLEGMEPLVVVYTKQFWKTVNSGSCDDSYPLSDESTTPINDCVIILQNMHVVHANQSFSRLIGRPLDSIKGHNIKRFFQASSIQALEKYISSISEKRYSTTHPIDISLAGRDMESAGNYSFSVGWIPYMDTGAVIGVLHTTKPKLIETGSSHYVPSAWDNFLIGPLTRVQVNERDPCTVLIPWALEQMHLLLNSDECILDVNIRNTEEFRQSYCWSASQTPNRGSKGEKPSDDSLSNPLSFEKSDLIYQDGSSKNSDDLLRIPIRKNKKTLGEFKWHPRSSDDESVIDWEKFDMTCTLLALKVWHQHCFEKAQMSQEGFNEIFGEVTR